MSNTEPVIPETKHVHTCVEPMQVLSNQIEQLQTQLAGCLTAAEGWAGTDWNRESYGWSPAFQATIELHERMTKAEADLAAARENASQNAGNYLACEKRFEEAIAQRDAANLRVEGLEHEWNDAEERFNMMAEQRLAVQHENAALKARVEQLSGPVTEGSTFTIKLSDGEDGWVVAECVELPGCVSQGKTQLSALSNINDAIRAVLTVRARSERSSYGVALAIDDNGNLVLYSDYARLERERERLRNALREARSALADYSRRSMWGYESDSDVSRAREAIDAALAPAQEPKA